MPKIDEEEVTRFFFVCVCSQQTIVNLFETIKKNRVFFCFLHFFSTSASLLSLTGDERTSDSDFVHLGFMATRNLSKTFKGKVNGQRLPPLPVANDSSSISSAPTAAAAAAVTQQENPTSILKKSKPSTDAEILRNPLPLDEG